MNEYGWKHYVCTYLLFLNILNKSFYLKDTSKIVHIFLSLIKVIWYYCVLFCLKTTTIGDPDVIVRVISEINYIEKKY